jgi:hypothetical protein
MDYNKLVVPTSEKVINVMKVLNQLQMQRKKLDDEINIVFNELYVLVNSLPKSENVDLSIYFSICSMTYDTSHTPQKRKRENDDYHNCNCNNSNYNNNSYNNNYNDQNSNNNNDNNINNNNNYNNQNNNYNNQNNNYNNQNNNNNNNNNYNNQNNINNNNNNNRNSNNNNINNNNRNNNNNNVPPKKKEYQLTSVYHALNREGKIRQGILKKFINKHELEDWGYCWVIQQNINNNTPGSKNIYIYIYIVGSVCWI